MGILFKHQEELEEAAKGNRRAAKPPPAPVEAKAETKVEQKPAKAEPKFDPFRPLPEPKAEAARPVLPPPPPVESLKPAKVAFSVEDFLKLAGDLPVRENAALVVRVVEASVASVNIHMTDILPEISRRESVLQDRIEATQKRLEELEVELVERRTELADLEAELAETVHLRELVSLAKGASHGVVRDTAAEETLVLATTPPGGLSN